MHERYRQTDRQTDRRQTTDRQTDGRAIAYSEREREFTFAKNDVLSIADRVLVLFAVPLGSSISARSVRSLSSVLLI